jgi:hypothetical protein
MSDLTKASLVVAFLLFLLYGLGFLCGYVYAAARIVAGVI